MKIAIDVAQTCSPRAGCGWAADLLARALVQVAPEHRFLLLHHFGTWLNPDTRRGTRIHAANVAEPLARYSVAQARTLWTQVAGGNAGLPGDPDIVHANCFQAPLVGPAKLVYTVYDISFWIHPEFTTEENRLVCQRGTLDALNRAAGLMFISEYSRLEFESLFPGVCERRGIQTVVTPLASRFPALERPRTQPPSGPWLAVGSIEPRKNYDLILDAIEIYWRRSHVRRPLVIAGGAGWKSADTRMRIRRLGQAGMVRYEGYASEDRLRKLYADGFALLFASHYEGFGLPVVEAMSQGCPVISTRNTSLPEVGGEAAIWCDLASSGEMAERMLRLENDRNAYLEASVRSLSQAGRFSWSQTARMVCDFYTRIAPVTRGPVAGMISR
ncbi:MAG: glycosyltransferase family 4 protein [Verrucomicrobia bacterium]|nr:glycosyltransferase family 4 protein [Verrucomicrobiota bacterium]